MVPKTAVILWRLTPFLLIASCIFYLLIYFGAVETKLFPRTIFTNSSYIDDNDVVPDLKPYNESDLDLEFAKRRQKVAEVCKKRYGKLTDSTKKQRALYAINKDKAMQSTLLIDNANRLLVCVIAKAGSTNMKKLLIYNSYNSTFDSPQLLNDSFVFEYGRWPNNLSLKPAHLMKKEEIETAVGYTKIIWVRNPLVRLVSAWHSKLSGINPYYSNVYGKHIVSHYRKNETTKNNATTTTSYKNDTAISVTLEEFFKYVEKEVRSFQMSDVHWSVFNAQCLPCYMDYQYIGKLENWNPEAHYVFSKLLKRSELTEEAKQTAERKFNTKGMQKALRSRPTSSDEKWRQLIRTIPTKCLYAVKRIFFLDFDLFGYDSKEFGFN